MKPKLLSFSRSYSAALRRRLEPGAPSGAPAAHRLGLRASSLGLEALDLARIHNQVLVELAATRTSSRARATLIRKGVAFFAAVITPLEEAHRGARAAHAHLKSLITSLTQRTRELATSNEELKTEILQRKSVEDSLRASELTTSRLLENSRQMQEELRHLSRRLLLAQEEERKRISRELHDVGAQTLTGINLRLATLKTHSAENAKDIQKKISIAQRLVLRSVEIVHRFARDLRPAVLDDLGLIPAVRSHLKGFREQTGMDVQFQAFAGVEKLDSAARTVLYRVVQEALTNVALHAKATTASVHIFSRGRMVCMDIHDNGKGFLAEGAAEARIGKRLGLLGMRERVEMVGGTFCVESAPGHATTLRIEIPQRSPSPRKRRAKLSGNATLKCP